MFEAYAAELSPSLVPPSLFPACSSVSFLSSGLSQGLEINPSTFKVSLSKKSISTSRTCAGQVVSFEGRHGPTQYSMSGVTLEENQMNTLKFLTNTRSQIRMTTDLGEDIWFYITDLSLTRQLKRQAPWYHSFQIEAVALDWS